MKIEEIKKIIEEKVNGVWIAEHTSDGHFYRHRDFGVLVKSVTGKLIAKKEHLQRWAIKKGIEWLEQGDRWEKLKDPALRSDYITGAQEAYTEFRDEAGSVGTLAHAVAEKYLDYWIENGIAPEDITKAFKEGADPRSIASARAVEAALKKHRVVPIASELLVGDIKLNVAGTLDLLCMWDGELAIIDFKTSNSVDDDYACQVAVYKKLFELMTGLKIKVVKILHLSKDHDKFTIYNIPAIEEAFRAYMGIAKFYDWRENGKVKVEKDVLRINLNTKYGLNKIKSFKK